MTTKPELIVYKEIVEGDVLKMQAKSNLTPSGGGARDLRFPKAKFHEVMHRIFTKVVQLKDGRECREAEVLYLDPNGNKRFTTLKYWPATNARPTEERIGQIHDSPALGKNPPASDKGRVFVTLTKFDDGIVRCAYAYEDDLVAGRWAPEVTRHILECMESSDQASANREHPRPTQGYYDFTQGVGVCGADK